MRSSGGFQIAGTPLIGRVLRFCRINFDAASKLSAVLDADARRSNVTEDRAIPLDFDAAARVEISDYLAVHNHVACVDFRVELRGRADGQRMAVQRNRAFDLSVDLQVFCTGDVAPDLQAGSQAREILNSGAARAHG